MEAQARAENDTGEPESPSPDLHHKRTPTHPAGYYSVDGVFSLAQFILFLHDTHCRRSFPLQKPVLDDTKGKVPRARSKFDLQLTFLVDTDMQKKAPHTGLHKHVPHNMRSPKMDRLGLRRRF